MDISLWLGGAAFLSKEAVSSSPLWVTAALEAWRHSHTSPESEDNDDEEEGADEVVDVWDLKHGRYSMQAGLPDVSASTYKECIQKSIVPPAFVCEVETLPKNAPIEWASLGFGCEGAKYALEGTPEHSLVGYLILTILDLSTSRDGSHMVLKVTSSGRPLLTCGWLSVRRENDLAELVNTYKDVLSDVHTVYRTTSATHSSSGEDVFSAQIIPCHRIWDWTGKSANLIAAYRIQHTQGVSV